MTLLSWILLTVLAFVLGGAGIIIHYLSEASGEFLSGFTRGAIPYKKTPPWVSYTFLAVGVGLLINVLVILFSGT